MEAYDIALHDKLSHQQIFIMCPKINSEVVLMFELLGWMQ